MAVTINWGTKVISVPQADLTFISGSLYEMDVNWFRQQLKSLEDDEAGMSFLDTHKHNTTVTVGGTILARVVELINNYTVTFTPNSQWAVRLVGGNNNIMDVLNVNQVQLRTQNSAGLTVDPGIVAQDKTAIIDGVWDEAAYNHQTSRTTGDMLTKQVRQYD